MAHNTVQFAPDLTDGHLFAAFGELALAPELADTMVASQAVRFGTQFYASASVPPSELKLGAPSEDEADLRVITNFTLNVSKPPGAVSIQFARGAPTEAPKITFSIQEPAHSEQLALKCALAARRAQLLVPRIVSEGVAANASVQALSEQVASLRELVNTQARNNEKIRAQLEAEYQAKQVQLQADFEARRARSEAELQESRTRSQEEQSERNRRATDEIFRRQTELEMWADRLKERESSLDLQGEREERRRLRRDIQDAAKRLFEKPDLSEDARGNFDRVASTCRWIAGGSLVILVVALFAPPVVELAWGPLSSGLMALAWSLRAFAGLALTVVLAYYVRWLSSWSKQVTSLELRSKQFALDIDRASWLVEMNLEYEKEGKSLQGSLIESFSRGLFEGDSRSAAREAPSTSLLHLIQNAESLKLGAAGAEVSITGSGVRKADKQARKAGES